MNAIKTEKLHKPWFHFLNKPWIKKAGKIGFLFFLVKGIVWLVILAGTMWGFLGS